MIPSALQRLDFLDAALSLTDLSAVPGYRLEKMVGDRKGSYSLRINRQWRVVFHWIDGCAHHVSIVDYH